MRQQKQEIVFDKELYDGEWPPADAIECVEWFSRKLETIPAKYRTTAKIEFGSASGYEYDHYATIRIYYYRPETDDELAAREEQEQLLQNELKAQELRILAELRAKYESQGPTTRD